LAVHAAAPPPQPERREVAVQRAAGRARRVRRAEARIFLRSRLAAVVSST
jgi:hypothetical protein